MVPMPVVLEMSFLLPLHSMPGTADKHTTRREEENNSICNESLLCRGKKIEQQTPDGVSAELDDTGIDFLTKL